MSFPRSDELASESRIKRANERDSQYKSLAKTGASLALTAGAGAAGLSSKIAPFLSELLPMDLAFKGISKVAPKVGDFLKNGMAQGLTLESGLGFLKDNMGTKEKAKDDRNIIEQYSPEIFQEIKRKLQGGIPLIEAANFDNYAFANYKPIIKKMEKDHKTSWLNIVKSVFGEGDMDQPQQQAPSQQNPNMQQNPQQAQGIDPAVMQIIQQGSEILKRFKGTP